MAFICGSLRSQKEDNYKELPPFSSKSLRKPSKPQHKFGSRRNKTAANPYSDRGLDKFAALLAELEHKRQQILTQKGSEDVSMVKFAYRSPNEAEPIIIKIQDHTSSSSSSTSSSDHQKDVAFVTGVNGSKEPVEETKEKPLVDQPSETIRFDQCKTKIGAWWKPAYNLPLFVILILVLLMFSGRSFAILFTSIGWYLVPMVNETILHNQKQPNDKEKTGNLKKSRRTDKQ